MFSLSPLKPAGLGQSYAFVPLDPGHLDTVGEVRGSFSKLHVRKHFAAFAANAGRLLAWRHLPPMQRRASLTTEQATGRLSFPLTLK